MAALIGLRKNCQRRRKSVPAELFRSALHEHARRFNGQGWKRIWLGARWIKRTCARQSRYAQLPFGFCVIRLEIRIGDWPVFQTSSRNGALPRTLHEINLVEPPIVGGEVNTAAADQPAIPDHWLDTSLNVFRIAKCGWLQVRVIGKRIQVERPKFLMIELTRLNTWSLLQYDYTKTIGRQFLGEDAAGGSGTDDYEVHRIRVVVFHAGGH